MKIERHLWDLDRPQNEIIQLVEDGWIKGATLDVLCGTGENALHISGFGSATLGIDTSQPLLRIAREKAQLMQVRRGVCARFKPGRPHRLIDLGELFETVIDLGLFQTLPENIKGEYVYSLDKVIQKDGRFILIQLASGDYEMDLVKQEAEQKFQQAGWNIALSRASSIELQNGRMASAWTYVFTKNDDR